MRPTAVAAIVLVCATILLPGTALAQPAARSQDADAAASQEPLQLSSDLRSRVQRGRDLVLEVLAAEGDDYAAIALRVTGDSALAEAVRACNDGRPVVAGEWIRVPLSLLSGEYRYLVLGHLFPEDRRDGEDWIHLARSGARATYDEGLWQVAEWFTGRGESFRELMRVNRLSSPELRGGQTVRIPGHLLHPAFRAGMRSDDGLLEFGTDERGPYAGYRIQAGEALYSSVVGRFSGRTEADDVRAVAELLAERSGIRDLRDIPVGYLVKIPLDLLESQYLPSSHPRRIEAEAARLEQARALEREPVSGTRAGLDGVLVVLDPGHGGRDLGTINNGVWEHDYVYDVTCRLKEKLERETSASVVMTLIDEQTGCTPSKTDKLQRNRQGTIQTRPTFLAREEGEAAIGVNLRWYLANSVFRQEVKKGRDPDRIVFLSIHADSRHSSLRGMMAYVPGAGYRTGTYGRSSKTYDKYAEVQEKRHVRFSKKQRIRSEAVSRKLADAMVTAFRQQGLPIQPH